MNPLEWLLGLYSLLMTGWFVIAMRGNENLSHENDAIRRAYIREVGHPSQPLAEVHPISSSPKFAPIADLIASNEAARVDAQWAQTVEDEFLNGFWGRP